MIIELAVFGLVVFNVGLAVWLVAMTRRMNKNIEIGNGNWDTITVLYRHLKEANKDQVIVNENFAKDIAELKTNKKKRK